MATTYTTRQGDTVDLVAWKAAGRTAELTEEILAANPGLADLGPVLPIGTRVTLPDTATEAATPTTISLWD